MDDVLAWIEHTADGGDDVTEEARRFARAREAAGDVERYKAEITRLLAKRSRLVNGFTDNIIPRVDYEAQLKEITEALEPAESGLAVARAREAAAEVNVIRAFGQLREEWHRLTPHGQREALAAVTRRIMVHPGPYGPGKVEPIPAWEV